MKKCKECSIEKESSCFQKRPSNKDGLFTKCKDCMNKYHMIQYYRPENINKRKNRSLEDKKKRADLRRAGNIRRNFGMSHDDYERMEKEQKGLCKICNQPENCKQNSHLCIDHCHKTGKIRGLLCNKCNKAIGLLNDDKQLLLNAINYL